MHDAGDYVEHLRRIFDRRRKQKAKGADDRRASRILAILGSARHNGNTAALTDAVFQNLDNAEVVNLIDYPISPYDYEKKNRRDGFLKIVKKMAKAEAIVFASPVYWYTMSGQMKIFFDRMTDLTDRYKPIGRSLAGKSAFLIATSNTQDAPPSFEPPFADTARYLDMRWGGMLHLPMGNRLAPTEKSQHLAKAFARHIESAMAASAEKTLNCQQRKTEQDTQHSSQI